MPYQDIIWDLDDEPDGNVQHCGDVPRRHRR